jgi:hypothetical protein
MTLSHSYRQDLALAAAISSEPATSFITPTIVNGRVYVGTTNSVEVFGVAALAFWFIRP